jgi:glycosyltransferase involved in cell wall biosynthesis
MQKINMMCPIGVTGYGITSLNIYKQLRSRYEVSLFPIGNPQVETEEEKNIVLQDIDKQLSYANSSSTLKIWHQFDLATRVGNGKYVGLTFFEIDKLKPIETHMINNMDTICVASNWAKDILENNGITTKIVISPLGVDPNIFNISTKESMMTQKSDSYVFCNIGKWEIRKGHDILIEVFNKAFSDTDNVELWMVNFNPFLSQEENMAWVNLYKNTKLGSKIKILPRVSKHLELAKLISLTDCGIFPARAEGWNNEIPEFFALDKPIITTNYSAHTEYCDKNNSYLIDIDTLCPAIDDKFFDGYGNWAHLGKKQQDQMVEYMRYVYKNDIRSNPGGLEKAKILTWQNTANIISEHI